MYIEVQELLTYKLNDYEKCDFKEHAILHGSVIFGCDVRTATRGNFIVLQ